MKEFLEEYFDLFNLNKRIREIDKNYVLVFNKKNKKFEVHNFSQRGSSLVMEANPLDARLIKRLRQTRVENANRFFRELDEYNLNLENERLKNLTQKTREINQEIANYSFIKNQDLSNDEIYKILNL